MASLLRRVGNDKLDAIEDAIQHAMMQALHFWCKDGLPKQPSAWLYQVAFRQLLAEFRNTQRRNDLLKEHAYFFEHDDEQVEATPLPREMNDALLTTLFVACDDGLAIESQLVFTLKSLCGFSIREISLRLFISEANVYKRFSRAKKHLKKQTRLDKELNNTVIEKRLPMVHRILYLIFTEGYLSSHENATIRKDLCEEAIRLATILCNLKQGGTPETYALLALMYFHLARLSTRQDSSGALLLLEQQSREQWNTNHIIKALECLEHSAQGETLSRYHVEASIAAEHCMAPSFKKTRWDKIVTYYELLEHISPSPIHYLNRAIAMTEWQGATAGLAILNTADIPIWLEHTYHWSAVQADLSFKCGDYESAHKKANHAIEKAPTESIKKLLQKRFYWMDI